VDLKQIKAEKGSLDRISGGFLSCRSIIIYDTGKEERYEKSVYESY